MPDRNRKQQNTTATAVDVTADNNDNDSCNKKGGEISETGPDFQGVNVCMNEGNIAITDIMASTCMEINSVGLSGAEVSEVMKSSGEHGAGTSQNGLIKPRPKWNRLLCMECGPVEETKGELSTSLGKRRVSAILEEDNADKMGIHGSKCGKTQDDLAIIAEAGVSEHLCQSQ